MPMSALNTEPNLAAPDDFYEALIALHRDLSEAQSALVNAKLILLLANHIGDVNVLARRWPRRARTCWNRGDGVGAPHANLMTESR